MLKTDRQKFIIELFQKLKLGNYVLLKHIDASVVDIDEQSDLDILISKKDFKPIMTWLYKSQAINKLSFNHKMNMVQAFLFFNDHSFLQLDFLFGFYRKEINYLNEKEVFEESEITDDGITVCSQRHLLEHLLLFNYLNFAGIPEKYISYFDKQPSDEKSRLIDYLNQKYQSGFTNFLEMRLFNLNIRKLLLSKLKKFDSNGGIQLLNNKVNYYWSVLKSCSEYRGFIITFSGVDGAGKSTILQEVKKMLEFKYRRNVVVLRHRPSLLPILSAYRYGKENAEAQAASKLPRQGKNKSMVNSLLRFLYYYSDYFIGQFYIKAKYLWRGYIVLYDRYYFDFIADPKRSNIVLDQAVPKFLYQFVHRPKLNLLLYARPELILKRKQELDRKSISELTEGYKLLFEELSLKNDTRKYLPIENIDKKETLKMIIDQYEILA